MQLTPEQVAKVQAKNVENLIRKAAEGKSLSAREMEILNQQANQMPVVAPRLIKTKAALAVALNFSRQRLHTLAKKEGFPQPGPDGFDLAAVVTFLEGAGIDLDLPSLGKGPPSEAKPRRNLSELKADLLKEQIAKLKFQNQVEQRQYIAKDEIARELTRVIHQFKSVLYGALENELPPILEGMKAADIQVKTRGALAEAFRTIESDKWATKK
tara:strand:- start:562 stop:1200 length:639 start_codon:yes stop_codon:yes gene_type:complete